MRNTDLLSPSSGRKPGQYDRSPGSKSPSFFFRNEKNILSALLDGSMHLTSFIEDDYHRLSQGARIKAFEIISDVSFVKKHSIEYPLLKARFNPNNQYRVKTFFLGKENVYECFMFEGKFHTGAQLFLKESHIIQVDRNPSTGRVKIQ